MRERRIIKQWVRDAFSFALTQNRTRFNDVGGDRFISLPRQTSPYSKWLNEKMCYICKSPSGKDLILEVRGDQVVTDLSTLPEECYDAVLSRDEVYIAIDKERSHQDDKWGANKPQSLPGFLIVLEKELQEARDAWVKNVTGDHAALNEIVQIAATAVACLEKYGTTGSAIATNDIPTNQQ